MSSLHVHYEYENGSANTIRPTSVTYPDGRVLTYNYGTAGGMNDRLSRVESLGFDGTGNLVQPAYLGLGTQVRTTMSEPQMRWDLATGTSPNPYAGLDRFGRVIDNKWINYNTSATLDQIKYTYDRASNRTSRENVVAKAQTTPKYFDELYGYDGSNRLTLMERGQLAGSPPSSITNKQFAQDWGLDPTGNWKVFKEDDNGNGTWDLNQTRTSNPVNEITAINETAGPSWVTPGYDSAGNMTTIPRPAEPTGDYTGVYDAWNRLVELRGLDDTVVGRYEYDGLTRRVVKHTFPGWEELEAADWDAMTEEDWNGLQLTQAHRRDYYYSAGWRVLEERVELDSTFERQYVWGTRYRDNCILRDRQLNSGIERLYSLQDGSHNVDATVDISGVVVERYSYTPYGMPSFLNPDFTPAANSEAYDWDVLYAGYKWDSESLLYNVRFRHFHPKLANWLARDNNNVILLPYNLNRYGYSNPYKYLDVFGKIDQIIGGAGNEVDLKTWINTNLIRKRIGSYAATEVYLTVRAGCIGLTLVNVDLGIDSVTGKKPNFRGAPANYPDMSNCFVDIKDAYKYRDGLIEKKACTPCNDKSTPVAGEIRKPRIFQIQYSTRNKAWQDKQESTIPPKIENGKTNLNNDNDIEAITLEIPLKDPTKPEEMATNYDFALLTEKGDPWYVDEKQRWLHANSGEDPKEKNPNINMRMKVKLADDDAMDTQYKDNDSGFDARFYCVACSRCFSRTE